MPGKPLTQNDPATRRVISLSVHFLINLHRARLMDFTARTKREDGAMYCLNALKRLRVRIMAYDHTEQH